jgi:hypothetical protein
MTKTPNHNRPIPLGCLYQQWWTHGSAPNPSIAYLLRPSHYPAVVRYSGYYRKDQIGHTLRVQALLYLSRSLKRVSPSGATLRRWCFFFPATSLITWSTVNRRIATHRPACLCDLWQTHASIPHFNKSGIMAISTSDIHMVAHLRATFTGIIIKSPSLLLQYRSNPDVYDCSYTTALADRPSPGKLLLQIIQKLSL